MKIAKCSGVKDAWIAILKTVAPRDCKNLFSWSHLFISGARGCGQVTPEVTPRGWLFYIHSKDLSLLPSHLYHPHYGCPQPSLQIFPVPGFTLYPRSPKTALVYIRCTGLLWVYFISFSKMSIWKINTDIPHKILRAFLKEGQILPDFGFFWYLVIHSVNLPTLVTLVILPLK